VHKPTRKSFRNWKSTCVDDANAEVRLKVITVLSYYFCPGFLSLKIRQKKVVVAWCLQRMRATSEDSTSEERW